MNDISIKIELDRDEKRTGGGVMMRPSLRARLKVQAYLERRSLADLIEEACKLYLDRLSQPQKQRTAIAYGIPETLTTPEAPSPAEAAS